MVFVERPATTTPITDARAARDALTSVHNPMGYPPRVKGKALAPRLDSLDDKTVFLVDCHFDDSGLLLEQVQAWFGEHMPQVRTQLVEKANVYARDDPE